MRKLLVLIAIITFALPAFGDDGMHDMHHEHHREGYVEILLNDIFMDVSDVPITEITVGDTAKLLGELSIAVQKDMHIEKSAAASFFMPGMGQFMNDDAGTGALFLTASIAVSAGTLLGSYFLLPDNLRFSELDYFNESYAAITNEWEGMSFMDLLPSMGVMAGGMLVDFGIRALSAKNAKKTARERIESGAIDFEPRLLLMPGGMGMGMKFHHK